MRLAELQPGYTLSDLTDLLDGQQYVYVDTYSIEPLVGAPMRYANAQEDVSVVPWGAGPARSTFFSKQVIITGLLARSTVGTEVDEQQATVAYSPSQLFQNQFAWPVALLDGRLDGGIISRDRYFAERWGSPWIGGCRMFSGEVASLDMVGRSTATLSVKSALNKLNVQMPRDLYTPICKNIWGDARCGVDKSSFAVVGTVGSTPTRLTIPWSSADPEYAQGKIHIVNTADSVTRVRTIARATSTHLYLAYPLDFDPGAGMTFVAYPGCNRTKERCVDFHGADWVKRFGGYPFVPVAETAA